MTSLAAEKCKQNRQYQYEDCLTDLSRSTAIYYHCLENLAWSEIDDEQQLSRALNDVHPLIQRRDSETVHSKHVERRVLLNPGPATTTDTVKYALVGHDICPREKEFGDLARRSPTGPGADCSWCGCVRSRAFCVFGNRCGGSLSEFGCPS